MLLFGVKDGASFAIAHTFCASQESLGFLRTLPSKAEILFLRDV